MTNGAFTEILAGLLAIALIYAAVVDIRTFTISNRLNLAIALLAPVYWLSVGLQPWPDAAIQVAVAAGVFVLLAGAFYAGMMGGGYIVYPGVFEEVLYEHPEVDEVAVVGVPVD